MIKTPRAATALRLAAIGAVLALSPATARAEQFINILTGGTSGVYYPIGVALSKIYGEKIPDARTQVQATKASVENLNLLQTGKGELALALGDSVKFAWEGNEEAGFKAPLTKLRGIAAVYPNYIQIAATGASGVKTLADLKGKSLSVGAPKSGTELNARAILTAAGLSYADLSKTEYLPFAESVELLKNRQLDATLQSAGLGVASIKDLATALPTTIVAVPAEVVEKIGAPYIAVTWTLWASWRRAQVLLPMGATAQRLGVWTFALAPVWLYIAIYAVKIVAFASGGGHAHH